MKRLVILNPQSRHGKAGRIFEARRSGWERKLGAFELHQTTGPGDATEKVRSVLKTGGCDQILIAGGDGSINEAFLGYWENGAISNTDVPLGIINLGTGNDFYRTVTGLNGDYEAALIENRFRLVDAAKVTAKDGVSHPFLNMSSVGMGGEMLRRLRASTFQSGAPAYFFHTLITLLGYRPGLAQIEWVDEAGESQAAEGALMNLFSCNGRFSGGGMEWAPQANLEDGLLRLTLVTGTRKMPLILQSGKLYRGEIDSFPGAKTLAAREIKVRSAKGLSLETDGEIISLPDEAGTEFHFEVLGGVFPLVI